ncbi:GntR family transcriptional regulator [Mariniphaga sediminis]|uniref:GntR family transcriptional regulator n=1 Tax=Mariniphaga sediminis TaxID=1628158 RepID=A0A399D5C0_9BACT|nr:GntR family transcriptional regulator [Mariniphaga sediminis]RIH67084.1 GntR family transcriptional regulator [Mariniphaga sediminis]
MEIKINLNSQIPVYKQIIDVIQELINTNQYKKGDFLPSMNALADDLHISKETVKKAYSILRKKGFIESTQGKGFYVTNNGENKIKILLLFDKISTYKQILYSSFLSTAGDTAEITIRLHNQDFELFRDFIEENLDNFDYYIVTPHFPLNPEIQKKVIKILKKIPNRKLILLDRYIDKLSGNFGAIYQDFEKDIYEGLSQGIDDLKKFKKLNIISMPGSMYAPLIEQGIKKFSTDNNIPFKIHKKIDIKKIHTQEVYLILNSQLDIELIELARAARLKGCVIGKDIGIISYNESPVNEIVLNGLTVLSTDFKKMGELAAEMIKTKSFKKIRCDFHLIRRTTF